MSRIPSLTKRPEEVFAVGLKYVSPDLEEGAYLVGGEVEVTPVGNLVAVGNIVIEPDQASQVISGGEAGEEYYVKFKVLTSGGHLYEDAIYVKVRDFT